MSTVMRWPRRRAAWSRNPYASRPPPPIRKTSTTTRSASPSLSCDATHQVQMRRNCDSARAVRQAVSRFRPARSVRSVVDPFREGRLMPPTHLCIVARPMRTAMRIVTVAMLVTSLFGCEQLDGRNRNRKGNNFFREMRFADAAGEYEKELKGTPACDNIPGVKTVNKQVCVKPGSTLFTPCDQKNVCASSFTCQKVDICTLDAGQLADLAATHYAAWLKAHPTDAETRGLMTPVWIDASQYQKAVDFWEGMLKAKPNDPEIMGALAGINLKANDWRKSNE